MDAAARHKIYAFFSRLFVREIDDAFVDVLAGELGRALLPELAASDEARLLRDHAAREAQLDADFVHVTIVNLAPYESFFLSDDAMVEAGAKNSVTTFYRQYGFEADLAAARSLSPDHIGIELELMAVLCEREVEAEARDAAYANTIRSIQRDFLSRHLLAWAPVYLLAVQRTARTTLYREGADAALQFLLTDHEALCAGRGSA